MDITEFLNREISKNYQVNDKLGAGGCSIVYKATRLSDQRVVAIKVLSLPETLEPSEIEAGKKRFCREALLMVTLHNPHVVECLDYGVFEGAPCIVLEFIGGKPLDMYIKEFGALPFKLSVNIICQLLNALESAHSIGVIHRDIKPGNILLTGEEDDPFVHLIDFGIASMTEGPDTDRLSTKMGSIRGTPAYMAPELFTGFASASPVSDLYAVGLVLLECLTGSVAITGVTMMEIAFKQTHQELVIPIFIPKCLAKVIQKSCAKLPDMRYQTAREMSDALKEALPEAEAQKDTCARAYMSGVMEIVEEKPSKGKYIAIAVAALVAIAIAVVLAVVLGSSSDEQATAPAPNTAAVQQPAPDNTAATAPNPNENTQNAAAVKEPDPSAPPAPANPPAPATPNPVNPANVADANLAAPAQNPNTQPIQPEPEPTAQVPQPAAPEPTRPAAKTNSNKSSKTTKKKQEEKVEQQAEPVKDKTTKKNNMVIPSNLI